MTLPYFIYFIKHAFDFCKVRIKLLGLTFKGKQNIFPHQQPSSSPTIALPLLYYKTTMKPIAIHSQQEPLICMLTQQGSLAVAQIVLSFLLSLLIYTFQVWESVNAWMQCLAYVLDNHWYLSIATLPDPYNRLKDAVAPLITHSIKNSLVIVFSKITLFDSHM